MRSCRLSAPRFVNPGYERAYRITYEFAEGLTPTQNGPPPASHEQARAGASLPTSAARSIPAGEPLPIHSGGRSREVIQILWPAEQTLVTPASCETDRADIDAGGLATVDRRLDFTPNPARPLRVWLRSNR